MNDTDSENLAVENDIIRDFVVKVSLHESLGRQTGSRSGTPPPKLVAASLRLFDNKFY